MVQSMEALTQIILAEAISQTSQPQKIGSMRRIIFNSVKTNDTTTETGL